MSGKKEMSEEERKAAEAMIKSAQKMEKDKPKGESGQDKTPLEVAIDNLANHSADFGVVSDKIRVREAEINQLKSQGQAIYSKINLASQEIKRLSSNGTNCN